MQDMASIEVGLFQTSYIERAQSTDEEVIGLRGLREIDNKNRKTLRLTG